MDDSRTQELLLELLQKVAVIEARLGVIEEIKLDAKVMNSRVDSLEAQNREHDKTIKSLEHRANIHFFRYSSIFCSIIFTTKICLRGDYFA